MPLSRVLALVFSLSVCSAFYSGYTRHNGEAVYARTLPSQRLARRSPGDEILQRTLVAALFSFYATETLSQLPYDNDYLRADVRSWQHALKGVMMNEKTKAYGFDCTWTRFSSLVATDVASEIAESQAATKHAELVGLLNSGTVSITDRQLQRVLWSSSASRSDRLVENLKAVCQDWPDERSKLVATVAASEPSLVFS